MLRGGDFYGEIDGRLDVGFRPPADPQDKIILSNVTHGAHVGTRAAGMGIKYVARGTEYYTIAGRTYAVGAGQFMCVSQTLASEVEVKKTGETTLGLCMFVRSAPDGSDNPESVERPIILPASCSAFGSMLRQGTTELLRPAADRRRIAGAILGHTSANLETVLGEVAGQLAALGSLKASTRYEILRKIGLARGHLHEVTERSIDLAELALVAGMSRFELLRHFRDCYGAPPATYHRRLRLQLAHEAVATRRLDCTAAAHLYGFASSSSFSHAYRRMFGRAPVRSMTQERETVSRRELASVR